MAWFIDYDVRDSKGKPGRLRIPVTEGTVPVAYETYADTLAASLFGSGLMSIGGITAAKLVMALTTTPISAQAGSEVRNKWQASMLIGSVPSLRLSFPASNPDPALVVSGSQIIADLSNADFSNVLTNLLNTAGTVHLIEPDEGTDIDGWGPVISQTRSRKRPRVGGSR